MQSRVALFSMILGIPLLAFAVAEGIQAHFDSELRTALRQHRPNADPAAISSLTIDRLCQDPGPAFREICSINSIVNLMSNAALVVGAVGLSLLLLIRLAGVTARNSRKLLLSLFKPGLYLTALILILLIIAYAALAMSAIYFGEYVLIGRIHGNFIGAIGLGALVGVFVLAKNIFFLIKKAQTTVIGTAISREEAPKLWGVVEQLSEKLGALRPENIVVGLDPNFFVTQADVLCLSANLSGRTLYCSLPLARILSTAEFSGIIGHELGHFKGLDTQYSQRFYPIYRGTASAIASLEEAGGEGPASIALLPAVAILTYFFKCFSIAESRISRDRELAADEAGASLCGAASLASALVKVHAFSGFWTGLQEAAEEALEKGRVFVNASKTYAEAVVNNANRDALSGIAETHLSHPTDTHPPLATRLEALKTTLENASDSALDVDPADPAIDLMESPEHKEEEISAAYQMILARRLGIDLDDVNKELE